MHWTQYLLRAAVSASILAGNAGMLLSGKRSPLEVSAALRKQFAIAAKFKNAKYVRAGGQIFLDPFAPSVPGPAFNLALENNCRRTYPHQPIYGQLAVTNLCPCRCVHCHVVNLQSGDLPLPLLLRAVEDLSGFGVPLLFFVGGEPFQRFDDLVTLVEAATPSMETRIFTSGVGASEERLRRLHTAGLQGIYVSLDHHLEAEHNRRRGNTRAFASACETITLARKLGFYVSVVCCVTRSTVANGDVFAVVDLAERLGGHSIQLNEIRPVGRATESPSDFALDGQTKEVLIDFYRRQNASRRPISIAMPWYNEEPDKFGCTATAGQKLYIDARGNVLPCELLKLGFGNLTEEPLPLIWERMRRPCRHAVNRCVVHDVAPTLASARELPLCRAESERLWPGLCALPPSDLAARFDKDLRPAWDVAGSPLSWRGYRLDLTPGRDFRLCEGHWLPRKLGLSYLTWGRTLYAGAKTAVVPTHEYLHLAQFHRYGKLRVFAHYLLHIFRGLLGGKNLAGACIAIPFEVEARAFEQSREQRG
ncbi:MAG: hypothetical protein A2284_09225 [Deltaproteobacteria bacterium RIFOXYA12_FULL_61_11]|nr:MAG: hypothetical protein A2284_09225 [Deltaproteobacteria bacterium RIFOXYA12_FULL_61_11]